MINFTFSDQDFDAKSMTSNTLHTHAVKESS
jgi:hypothetical protein